MTQGFRLQPSFAVLAALLLFVFLFAPTRSAFAQGTCWDIRVQDHRPCGWNPPSIDNSGSRRAPVAPAAPTISRAERERAERLRAATTTNNEGVALADKGEYDKALEKYEEAVRLNPDNETARANLAIARA